MKMTRFKAGVIVLAIPIAFVILIAWINAHMPEEDKIAIGWSEPRE